MKPKIDFLLHEVLPDGCVTGRNCGADASLGTVFTALCRRDFPATKPGEEVVSPEPAFVCGISLRLDAIEMYRRSMDFVAHGYTAMLSLSGSGLPTVAELLSTAPKLTLYSLCTADESNTNGRYA